MAPLDYGTGRVAVVPDMSAFGPELTAGVQKAGVEADAAMAKSLSSVDAKVAQSSRGFSEWGTGIKTAAGVAGIAVGGELIKGGLDAAEGIEKSTQRMQVALDAIHQPDALAGIDEWARSFSEESGILRGDLLDMTSKLATLGRSFFEAAGPDASKLLETLTQDLENMSAATGRSAAALMRSLAPQILNTPEKAVAGLEKIGALTDAQASRIRDLTAAGDDQAATEQILIDLQGRYADAAARSATPTDHLKVSMNEAGVAIGEVLMPVISAASGLLSDLGPVIKVAGDNAGLLLGAFAAYKFTPGILTAVGDAVTMVGAAIADLIPGMGILTTETVAMGTAEAGLAVEATTAGAAVAAANVEMTATNPLALLAAAAVASLYVAFKELQAVISGDFSSMLTVKGDAPASWDRLAGGIAATTFTLGQLEKANPPMLADPALFKQAQQWQAMATGMLDQWQRGADTAGAATDNLAGSTRTFGTQLEYARERQMGLIPFVTQAAASVWDEGRALDHARDMASRADSFFGTHIQTVQDLARAYHGWQQQTADSINGVIADLGNLAQNQNMTAEQIAGSLDSDLADMRAFGSHLDKILGDNSKGAQELVQQLIAMGPAGEGMAAKIAGATPAVRKHIEDDIGRSLSLSKDQAGQLEQRMVGALDNIAAALLVVEGKFNSFGDALYALNHKHVDVYVTTHYQQVGSPGPNTPAGAHVDQTAADGYYGWVDHPTTFLAGEAHERELVSITPEHAYRAPMHAFRAPPQPPAHSGGMPESLEISGELRIPGLGKAYIEGIARPVARAEAIELMHYNDRHTDSFNRRIQAWRDAGR